MSVLAVDVPLLTELPLGWRFSQALPSGGMAVTSEATGEVLLLDGDLRVTIAVPLPGVPDGARVSVSEQAGLVALTSDDGLAVFDLTGRPVYRLDHDGLDNPDPCRWTDDGALMWTVLPGGPGIDVIAVASAGWTVLGRVTVNRDPLWQTSHITLVADPATSVAAVQGVLTNGDGTYSACLRMADEVVTSMAQPTDEGLLEDCLLLDVRPAGGEFLMLEEGFRDLYLFSPKAQQITAKLSWSDLAGPEPGPPAGGEVSEGYWHPSQVFYLTNDHLVTGTNGAQLLLLDRWPLRLAAQLNLQGYDSDPFTGWDIYLPGAGRDRNYLNWFDPWSNGRIVVAGRRIFDVGAALAGARTERLAGPAPPNVRGAIAAMSPAALVADQEPGAVGPSSRAEWFSLSDRLRYRGDLDGAAAAALRAAAIAPEVYRVQHEAGRRLRELGHLSDALACAERAVGLAPEHGDLHFELATVFIGLGRHTDALAAARAATEHAPKDPYNWELAHRGCVSCRRPG